jgi:hypothetical protein
MIEVIKGFYKLSEKQTYNIGQKVEFDKETEQRLVNEGLAIEIKQVKKPKVNKK